MAYKPTLTEVDTAGNLNHLVDKTIGDAYSVVREVYKNLPFLKFLADRVDGVSPIEFRDNAELEQVEWKYMADPEDEWQVLITYASLTQLALQYRNEAANFRNQALGFRDDTQEIYEETADLKDAVQLLVDSINGVYYGTLTEDPLTNPVGDAIAVGDYYYNDGSVDPAQVGLRFVNAELEWEQKFATAYQIAVANGFVGSEADWLLSLKGEQGEQGEQGIQGIPGEAGEPGVAGADGGVFNVPRLDVDSARAASPVSYDIPDGFVPLSTIHQEMGVGGYCTDTNLSVIGSIASSASSVIAKPILVSRDMTISEMKAVVGNTAVPAGSFMLFGIFESASDGLPGELLGSSLTIPENAVAYSVHTETFGTPLLLEANTVYWQVAVRGTGAPVCVYQQSLNPSIKISGVPCIGISRTNNTGATDAAVAGDLTAITGWTIDQAPTANSAKDCAYYDFSFV